MVLNSRSLLGCIGTIVWTALPTLAQTEVIRSEVVQWSAPSSPTQHLGSGPIDLNSLPADVLNCDVCRQRLGLPPLVSMHAPKPKPMAPIPSGASIVLRESVPAIRGPKGEGVLPPTSSVSKDRPTQPPFPSLKLPSEPVAGPVLPMLGSPGLLSSQTADQLASQGLIVEEFRPPVPEEGAIRLEQLPLQARQQFLNELGLPLGARIMSANVLGPEGDRKVDGALQDTYQDLRSELDRQRDDVSKVQSLRDDLIPLGESVEPLQERMERLQDRTEPLLDRVESTRSALDALPSNTGSASGALPSDIPEPLKPATADPFANTLAQQVAELQQQNAQLQSKLEQADATNRDVLKVLEARTAATDQLQVELAKMQKQLHALQKEMNQQAIGSNDKPAIEPDPSEQPKPKDGPEKKRAKGKKKTDNRVF